MDEAYFESYADLAVHRLMLQDRARTLAFQRAIESVVRRGQRVLDVGAGTGILSFFAARAGAGHVDAVDHSAVIEEARALAQANGLAECVVCTRGLAEEVELEAPVDVLVSEWFGYFALAETMFKSFVAARDRHLKPDGVTIPAGISLFIAPIEDPAAYVESGPGMWEAPVYGFDFSPLLEREMLNLETVSREIGSGAYLAPPAEIVAIDCRTDPVEAYFFDGEVEFTFQRGGSLHGFAGHFEAELAPGVVLSTASTRPLTHWRQSYFPIREREVKAGDRLRLVMRASDAERDDRRLPLYFFEGEHWRADELIDSFFYCHDASFE